MNLSIIIGFAESEFETILSILIISVLSLIFRRGILSYIHRFTLWISNRPVKISKIVMYLSTNISDFSHVKDFLDNLQNDGFSVEKMADKNGYYNISKHSLLVKLTINNQEVESADEFQSGIKLKAEITDLDIPYRTGLPNLNEIIPVIKTNIDRTFKFKASEFSLKLVIPKESSSKKDIVTHTFSKDKRLNITELKDAVSIVETNPNVVIVDLKKVLSLVRQPIELS